MINQQELFTATKNLSTKADQIAGLIQNDFDHPDAESLTADELRKIYYEMMAQLYCLKSCVQQIESQATNFFVSKLNKLDKLS